MQEPNVQGRSSRRLQQLRRHEVARARGQARKFHAVAAALWLTGCAAMVSFWMLGASREVPVSIDPNRQSPAVTAAKHIESTQTIMRISRSRDVGSVRRGLRDSTRAAPSGGLFLGAASVALSSLRPLRQESDDPEAPWHMARLAQLEHVRKHEARDELWASSMEDGVATAFAAEEIQGSELRMLSCASTLCAVRVEHESRAAAEDFAEHFDELSPDHGAGYIVHLGDEEAGFETAMFLAREGSETIDIALRRAHHEI